LLIAFPDRTGRRISGGLLYSGEEPHPDVYGRPVGKYSFGGKITMIKYITVKNRPVFQVSC
jgi:hypothetical protein